MAHWGFLTAWRCARQCCGAREIPRPAGKSAGLRDDARYGCSAIRLNGRGDARQIRFDFAQSRLWLGLKNGYARDDGDESKGTLQASSRIAR
jgi:hypothetical protein